MRSCRQKAVDRKSNKEKQLFLLYETTNSWSLNSSLLKIWEKAIWIGLFDTYIPHPKYYKPEQCSSFWALESQSGQTELLYSYTGVPVQGWCFVANGEVACSCLGESKSGVKIHLITFLQDPAESSTLSQLWRESNSQCAGSFPSFTSSRPVEHFHSSLSHRNFDVQWVRQVDPAWTLSLISAKNLPCCLCTELLKRWCAQLNGYFWPHCSSRL